VTTKHTGPPFKDGAIDGVLVRDLVRHMDERGWLCELFRHDELPPGLHPHMTYASLTLPGVTRGPHAHREQTDTFCFIGPGHFKIVLWDDRRNSPTYQVKQTVYGGQDRPRLVLVPPGVVHGYRCLGPEAGLVFNAPNRLYAGPGKKGPVDEIRYEDAGDTPFRL